MGVASSQRTQPQSTWRKGILHKGALATCLLTVLAFPTSAEASSLTVAGAAKLVDCSTNHCYGQTNWSVSQIHGISGVVNVKCLVTPTDTINNFVNAEMWQITAKGVSGSNWVETGMTHGVPRTDRWWFTAHQRPGIPYEEFYIPGGDSLNTNYAIQIQYRGNNTWNIYRNGVQIGTSASNPGPSANAQAGTEMTKSDAMVNATIKSLLYEDTAGKEHSGWVSTGSQASLISDPPATAKWITQYKSLEFYANKSFCGSGSVVDTESESVSSFSEIATRMAIANGGSAPKTFKVVRTHQRDLARIQNNGSAPTNNEVDVIEISGDFVGNIARVPPGEPKPKGRYIYISLDASTRQVVGWSLLNNPVDMGQVGKVTEMRQ